VWFSAQDLDAGDADYLYDLLDDGDGNLTVGELISGVARLKGAARSIDLFGLMHLVANLYHRSINGECSDLRSKADASKQINKSLKEEIQSQNILDAGGA